MSLHPIDAALEAKAEAGVQFGRLGKLADTLFDKRPCDAAFHEGDHAD